MERYNYNTGRRTRVMSESTTKEPRKTRSRLFSVSTVSETSTASSKQPPRLHSHTAPSFSLLGSSSSKASKEERRCMLTASERKVRDIRDPEEELLRAVLVSNTMRRLTQDQRKAENTKRSRAVSRVRL